jgi:hypothetical protein
LVTKALAAARRHDAKAVALLKDGIDDVLLRRTKVGQTELVKILVGIPFQLVHTLTNQRQYLSH